MRLDETASRTLTKGALSLCLAALGSCLSVSASALTLPLAIPGQATRADEAVEPMGTEPVAVGPWRDGAIQVIEADGAITRTAWRIELVTATSAEIMAPLREELASGGYEILFECATDACGGFDFRYALSVLPEPKMHVDLGDFRYLAATRKAKKGEEFVTLLVSRSSRAGFVQVTTVDPDASSRLTSELSTKSPDLTVTDLGASAPDPDANVVADPIAEGTITDVAAPSAPVVPPDQIAARIESDGRVALDDLVFATGSSELGPGNFASLASLAAYLAANPGRSIMLVGHTDSDGDLAVNIALSKRRAQSVMNRLVADYGVNPAQVSAEGAGFLAPRASNLTDEGRTENRRVEALLASTR